jgi:hypothetical protein
MPDHRLRKRPPQQPHHHRVAPGEHRQPGPTGRGFVLSDRPIHARDGVLVRTLFVEDGPDLPPAKIQLPAGVLRVV